MLPVFAPKTSSFKRAVIAAVTAFSLALPAAPALAWGQRERDTLTGAVGALVIAGIINDAKHRQPAVVQPQPMQPAYVVRHDERRYDGRRYVERRFDGPRHGHHRPYVQPQPSISIYSTPAARAFNSYSSGERRMIQRQLMRYGYYRGGIDGSFGPGTYSGIVAYARAQGQGAALGSMNQVFSVYDGLIY